MWPLLREVPCENKDECDALALHFGQTMAENNLLGNYATRFDNVEASNLYSSNVELVGMQVMRLFFNYAFFISRCVFHVVVFSKFTCYCVNAVG